MQQVIYLPNLIKGISLVIFLFIGSAVLYSPQVRAQVEKVCEEQMKEAEEYYKQGEFSLALDLIKRCLATKGISEEEKGEAYRFMGIVYMAQEYEKEANNAFKNLLIMVPNYIHP